MQLKYFKNEKGIGLIEVIAALAIAVIVITALVAMSVFTLKSSLESKMLLQATKQANVELELIRAVRDTVLFWDDPTGTNGFWDKMDACDSYVFPDPIPSGYDPCTAISNPNKCNVNMSNPNLVVLGEKLYGGPLPTSPGVIRTFFVAKSLDSPQNQQVRVSIFSCWDISGKSRSTSVHSDFTNWQNK